MGYTHYWDIAENVDDQKFRQAIRVMGRIVKDNEEILAGPGGEGKPEFTMLGEYPVAEGKEGLVVIGSNEVISTEEYIAINGIDDESRESFIIGTNEKKYDFCKTVRKPYDVVVTACLVVLKFFLGDQVNVSSDGIWSGSDNQLNVDEEIFNGIRLAAKYVPIKNPVYEVRGKNVEIEYKGE